MFWETSSSFHDPNHSKLSLNKKFLSLKLSNEGAAAEVEDVDVEGDDVGPRVGLGLRPAHDAPAVRAAVADQVRVEHDAVLQPLLPGPALLGIRGWFWSKMDEIPIELTDTTATRARVSANEIFILDSKRLRDFA